MIVVKLQGGLGNQMFQYAAAAGIGNGEPVILDFSFLEKHQVSSPTFTARTFELAIFSQIKTSYQHVLISKTLKSKNLFFKILRRLFLSKTIAITDLTQNLISQYQPGRRIVYLDGYFQNEKNFRHIRGELLERFKFPALRNGALAWLYKIRSETDPVSMHIRRGDYLKTAMQSFHGILPMSYYKEAKKIIETKVTAPVYFVFSDDPTWCSENITFLDSKVYFVSDTTATWEDMCLMTQCKHHIIANSSYSWWGAWLNGYENKTVIAPKKWFEKEPSEIVPQEWIKI